MAHPFLSPTLPSPFSSPLQPRGAPRTDRTIALIVVGGLFLLAALIVWFTVLVLKRRASARPAGAPAQPPPTRQPPPTSQPPPNRQRQRSFFRRSKEKNTSVRTRLPTQKQATGSSSNSGEAARASGSRGESGPAIELQAMSQARAGGGSSSSSSGGEAAPFGSGGEDPVGAVGLRYMASGARSGTVAAPEGKGKERERAK